MQRGHERQAGKANLSSKLHGQSGAVCNLGAGFVG